MSLRAAFLLLCCLALPQCGQPAANPSAVAGQPSASAASPVESEAGLDAAPLSKPDMASICRATLAAVNGHDLSIMRVTGNSGDVVQVRYARPSDGKLWTNECRVEGDRVAWRTVDAFGAGSGEGRWNSVAAVDDIITYRLEGRTVSITTSSPDGSLTTETYAIEAAS